MIDTCGSWEASNAEVVVGQCRLTVNWQVESCTHFAYSRKGTAFRTVSHTPAVGRIFCNN